MSSSISLPLGGEINTDRVGVVASVFCAVHCAVTPVLLLMAPAFGKIWSHPASHWLAALFVVPIAAFSIRQGYLRHRRRWIPICGMVGILLLVAGAAVPYLKAESSPVSAESDEAFVDVVGEEAAAEELEEPFVFVVGEEAATENSAENPTCADTCCPSLVTDADGNTQLVIPAASIITTLGGLALILTHAANLCCCRTCEERKSGSFLKRIFANPKLPHHA